MTKRVYIVRHGLTAANVEGRSQTDDSPLSDEGFRQAAQVAKRCQGLEADVIIASPLVRATQTAQAIHEATKAPIEINELFREHKRPPEIFNKTINDQILNDFFHEAYDNHIFEKDWHFSSEENTYNVNQRAQQAIEYLEQHEAQNIIIIGHGNFMRHVLIAMAGIPWDSESYHLFFTFLKHTNTGITMCTKKEVEYKYGVKGTGWGMNIWNDHAHL